MVTTLFIATSLDGYIAGPDDDVSWLFTDADYGFDHFYEGVDALVMGKGTYNVVRGLGKWPYAGKKTVVVTTKGDFKATTPDTAIFNGDLHDLADRLADSGVKRLWLVGGGELVVSFLKEHLIQEVVVSLHPVLLGKGVPLFPGMFPKTILELREAESFESGLVQLTYGIAKKPSV